MSTATTLSTIVHDEAKRYHAFINLAFLLAFLTSVEIVIIFLPFASWLIVSSLIVLSSIKFFCVILWFMHLIYDKLFLFLVFMAGLLIALGTVIALMYLFTPADLDPAYYSTLEVLGAARAFV